MSITSFLFYVENEPYDCGCYYDCHCDRHKSYITMCYNLNDAANFLCDRIKNKKYNYIDTIIVNGIPVHNVPKLVIRKSNSEQFFNPINCDNHDEINKWFPDELTGNSEVDKEALRSNLKKLDTMFTLTGMMIKPYLLNETEKMQEAMEQQKDAKRQADLEKLAELKKLYPDA